MPASAVRKPSIPAPVSENVQAGAGLRAFARIAEAWKLSGADAMALLGMDSRSTYYELLKRAHAYGATGADASWILEDNDAMLAFFREAGIPANRRWRIYEKPITSA